ncbi:hypothetical protein D3C81_1123170 [compost metagenome]
MAAFLALDDIHTLESLQRLVLSFDPYVEQFDILSFLSEMDNLELIHQDENKYISLVPRVNLIQIQNLKLETFGLSNLAGGDA